MISGGGPSGGQYCAQAGMIEDEQSSVLSISLTGEEGEISFYRKVSSEADWDRLIFSIDGQIQAEWSGDVDWEQVSFPVAAGRRLYEWRYVKDPTLAAGFDTAWIDNIVFPVR